MLFHLNKYKASNTQGYTQEFEIPRVLLEMRQNSAITQGNPGLPWVFSLMLVESAADHVLTRKDQTRHEAEKNPWQKNKKINQL